MRRLLPHVMHLAFLGVVLSHLVSAVCDRDPRRRDPKVVSPWWAARGGRCGWTGSTR